MKEETVSGVYGF